MGAHSAENGVKACAGEARSNTWVELERRSQHCAFHGIALLIVVGIVEEKRAVGVPGIHQFRGLDLSVPDEVSLVILRVDDHAYLVTALDFRIEVHLPGEHRGKAVDEIVSAGLVPDSGP